MDLLCTFHYCLTYTDPGIASLSAVLGVVRLFLPSDGPLWAFVLVHVVLCVGLCG